MVARLKPFFLISFILVVAAVLRFWNYFALTFTYDELNAMSRTIFPDFTQLINYGVKVDSHPSLIQVLMWGWSRLFGDSEASVKFPFVLMGIAAVYLSFAVAKKMFGETCALITSAFIACLTFTVMYSQIARPYVSGMFFGLGLLNALINYPNQRKTKDLFFIFLFSVLCLYNHHFSACFAFFACLFAFMFIPAAAVKNYVLTGILIALAYLPELPISYFQLHVVSYLGGLAGIATPENNYLPGFLAYSLNYSWVMYAPVLVLIALSLFFFFTNKTPDQNRYRLYCALLFFAPYLVGFFYSTRVSQVMQYSTLIFGFPYLIMLVFSGLPPLSFFKNSLAVALVLTPGIYTLAKTRHHYTYFYRQPFDEMYKETARLSDSLKPSHVSVHMNTEPYFHYYYHKKYGHDIKAMPRTEQLDLKNFRENLDHATSDYIVLANPYDEYVHLAREKFPYLLYRRFSYSMNLYCYSRKSSDAARAEQFPFVSSFTPGKNWSAGTQQLKTDSAGNFNFVEYTPADEFGLLYSDTAFHLARAYDEKINFAFEYWGDTTNMPLIACEVKDGEQHKDWMGYELKNYHSLPYKWTSVYYSVNAEYFLNNFGPKALVKLYVWNNGKSRFRLRHIRVFTTKFNKNLFKLLDPFNP